DRYIERGVPHEDGEPLAAVAGRDVVLANGPRDRARDRPEHLVADLVAVAVVEPLEPVDVDHQDADRVLGSTATGQQGAELVEVAAVRQAGQRIRGRPSLGLAV